MTIPKCQISTLELSPCVNYRPVTTFLPCPEVVIITHKHCSDFVVDIVIFLPWDKQLRCVNRVVSCLTDCGVRMRPSYAVCPVATAPTPPAAPNLSVVDDELFVAPTRTDVFLVSAAYFLPLQHQMTKSSTFENLFKDIIV